MKTKAIILLLLGILSVGCSTDENEESNFHPKGTYWKLSGYVNVIDGKLIEAEPKYNEDFFTFAFVSDSVGIGETVSNPFVVQLFSEPIIQMISFNFLLEGGNVDLFYEAIKTVDSCKVDEEGLKFFYNGGENYLLFDRVFDGKKGYIDTTDLNGTGYLFLNSVPSELQNKKNVIYIIYNEITHSATFSADYPKAFYNGNILNISEFIKGWKIPDGGIQIDYAGRLYQQGIYWSQPPSIGGYFVLTTLNKM
ncbi:MAG: hypothetical protein LBJ72_12040 [Dysgonamonadaceae bacterium]|jgi:hypothetical protein|nr:hypothetical protein [Dysgonamonadaceae bacterium]